MNEITNITNNGVHLCNSCSYDYPKCDDIQIIFGDGIGNDNICCCNKYEPLWTKEMMEHHKAEVE